MCLGLAAGRAACAQQPAPHAPDSAVAGPPSALSRELQRGPGGRLQIAAERAERPVRVDGVLDEEVWRRAAPAGGFTQSEPDGGAPASESTDVRVAYDAEYLYVGALMHDREPDRAVVNDIRKDFSEGDQDTFEVILDTFGDRRNGYVFATNVEGARADRQTANEGREVNASWDAVWTVRVGRTADGWTAEFAIPFRALRFDRDGARPWGVNFSRRIRRRNEVDFWAPVPRAFNITRVSLAGDLVGLRTGSGGRDLRVKPYVLGNSLRDFGDAAVHSKVAAGADVKLGVAPGLTLDATLNPDFAQAEADEQQVNLTQFSQFFPEKRDFFLENSGIFYVGDAARNNRVNPTPTPDEDLLLFFSRRIGLAANGRPVPLDGGVRLTGRAAGVGIGALAIQARPTDGQPRNEYGVLRLRRNVFSGSDVGVIAMTRQSVDSAGDYNRVFGGDASLRFFQRLDWSTYLVRTQTPGYGRGQYAARTSLNWEGNFFHGKGGVLSIGEGFKDDLGFYRRTGVKKWFADIGVRPRPAALRRYGVRELHPHIVWDYYADQANTMAAKRLHTGYTVFLNDGGYWELSGNPAFQRIDKPFRINRGIDPIPAGSYGWTEWTLRGGTDPSRPVALSLAATTGGLWSGTQRTVNGSVTVRPSYKFRLATGVQRTDATLRTPDADFVATLWTARSSYSFTTNMFVDALSQYDPTSHQLNANVRFNLIHHPLSDLFVVYNDQRVLTPESPVAGRSVIVKFTQTLAF